MAHTGRTYLCIDLMPFYASVECADRAQQFLPFDALKGYGEMLDGIMGEE